MVSQKEPFEKAYSRKMFPAILLFYGIAVSLRYLTNKTHFLSGLDSTFLTIILQAIGPTIGALVAFKVFQSSSVMSFKGSFKNFLVPLSIYWLLPILLIETVAYFSTDTSPKTAVFTILVYGLLEEIGWRGFLQQALVVLPKFIRLVVITTLWFIWHLNFDLSSSNLLFFLVLLFGSWTLGFVADKTNSFFCVSAIHSLNNFYADLSVSKVMILTFLLVIWILSIVYRQKLGGLSGRKSVFTTMV